MCPTGQQCRVFYAVQRQGSAITIAMKLCKRVAAALHSAAAGLAGVDRLALAWPDGGAWLVDDGLAGHPESHQTCHVTLLQTFLLTDQDTFDTTPWTVKPPCTGPLHFSCRDSGKHSHPHEDIN